MNRERLKETIRKAEGFTDKGYEDNGQRSGGYGHKLPESWPVDYPITRDDAEDWLDEDVNVAIHDVNLIFTLPEDTTDRREEALIEMAYNLGRTRLSKFVKAIAAVDAGEWELAAHEFEDSLWFRQVGARAVRLVNAIRNG